MRPEARKALIDTLIDMFSAAEFSQILAYNDPFHKVIPRLPDPYMVAPATWFSQAVDELAKDFGSNPIVLEGFVKLLHDQRAYRVKEIDRMRTLLFEAPTAVPPPAEPAPAQESPPNRLCVALQIHSGAVQLRYQTEVDGRMVPRDAHGELDRSELAKARTWLEQLQDRPDNVSIVDAVALALTRATLRDRVAERFGTAWEHAAASRKRFHLSMSLDDQVERLPWELLRHPSSSYDIRLAEDRTVMLSRAVALEALPGRPLAPLRPTILVITAGIRHRDAIRAEGELVAELWRQRSADVVLLHEARRDALWDAAESRKEWTAVHFAGHGERGMMVLEDGPLSSLDLARMLAGRVYDVVYLSACYGASAELSSTAEDNPRFTGIAKTLVGRGIPHIVACGAKLDTSDAARAAARWHNTYLSTGFNAFEASLETRTNLLRSRFHAYALFTHHHTISGGLAGC